MTWKVPQYRPVVLTVAGVPAERRARQSARRKPCGGALRPQDLVRVVLDLSGELTPGLGAERKDRARAVLGVAHQDAARGRYLYAVAAVCSAIA